MCSQKLCRAQQGRKQRTKRKLEGQRKPAGTGLRCPHAQCRGLLSPVLCAQRHHGGPSTVHGPYSWLDRGWNLKPTAPSLCRAGQLSHTLWAWVYSSMKREQCYLPYRVVEKIKVGNIYVNSLIPCLWPTVVPEIIRLSPQIFNWSGLHANIENIPHVSKYIFSLKWFSQRRTPSYISIYTIILWTTLSLTFLFKKLLWVYVLSFMCFKHF